MPMLLILGEGAYRAIGSTRLAVFLNSSSAVFLFFLLDNQSWHICKRDLPSGSQCLCVRGTRSLHWTTCIRPAMGRLRMPTSGDRSIMHGEKQEKKQQAQLVPRSRRGTSFAWSFRRSFWAQEMSGTFVATTVRSVVMSSPKVNLVDCWSFLLV